MTRRTRAGSFVTLAAVLAAGVVASLAVPPAPVTVTVAVEQPVPISGPRQLVPWTLVRGLTAEDFDVVSDGQACPIVSFSDRDVPLSVVVLIDVSASTEVTVAWLLDPVQTGLARAFRPGDRVAFGRFGGTAIRVDRQFTDRPPAMIEAARAVLTLPVEPPERRRPATATAGRFGPVTPDPVAQVRGLNGAFGLGGSPAWDAVDEAVTVLESEPGRRAIILVTDGRSTGNVRSLDEAIRHATEAGVSVFVVGEGLDEEIYQDNWTVKAQVRPTVSLEGLARTTGGAYAPVFGPERSRPRRIDALAGRTERERLGGEPLRPAGIDERAFKTWVGGMMAGFADELRGSYAVSFFAPLTDARVHSLDVRVRKPGLKVRARQHFVDRSTLPQRDGGRADSVGQETSAQHESARRAQHQAVGAACNNAVSRGGEIGRRTGLKIPGLPQGRAGSIPAPGTNAITGSATVRPTDAASFPVK